MRSVDAKENANFVNSRVECTMPCSFPESELLQVLWGLPFPVELRNSLETQTAVDCRGATILLEMDAGPEGVLLTRDWLSYNCV